MADEFNADELLVATQGGDEKAQQAASQDGKIGGEDDDKNKGTDDGSQGGQGGSTDDYKGGQDGQGGQGGQDDDKGDDKDKDKGNKPTEEELADVKADLTKTFTNFNDPNNTEAQELKTELLALVEGATDFDEQGNAIDKDGKQLATFEELVNKVAEQPQATFDAQGNEVDAEGNIVRTKQQIDIANSEVNQIAEELGYNIVDDNNNPILYKGGTEGLQSFIKDAVEQDLRKQQDSFFASNPVLREVSKHLLLGGKLEDFNKPVDYSKIDVKNLTVEQKKSYIRQSYIAEGTAPERADKVLSLLDEKTLDDDVKDAFNVLKAKEAEVQEARDNQLQRQEDDRIKENQQYWRETKEVVSKGNLDGFTIPEADRDDFFKYLSFPVKDGLSQDMIDIGERSRALELKEAYYRYKGYDVSKIVKQEVANNRVSSLRERIRKSQELQQPRKPASKGGSDEVDWDAVQG